DINNGIIENFEFAPNPASDEANIRFDLLKDTKTLKLEIYDSKGDMIANIPVANYNKGQNYINLNTSGINSGSYYLVLNADNAKMCLPIRIIR
ncbi:MAG: T9SS type A sorting domain-containing protein, partial [bacterium]